MNGMWFEVSRTNDRAPGAAFLQRMIGEGRMLSVVTSFPGEVTGGFITQWEVDDDGQGYWARLEEVPAEAIVLRD